MLGWLTTCCGVAVVVVVVDGEGEIGAGTFDVVVVALAAGGVVIVVVGGLAVVVVVAALEVVVDGFGTAVVVVAAPAPIVPVERAVDTLGGVRPSELARGRYEFQIRSDGSAVVGAEVRGKRDQVGGGQADVQRSARPVGVVGRVMQLAESLNGVLARGQIA